MHAIEQEGYKVTSLAAEGVQNRFPQNVPLWHVNCFELNVVKTLQAYKKLLPLS